METTNKAIKAFSERKATAETMRMIFGILAILYIGFIIWSICIKNWSSLWWEINVWLLLVTITFNKNSEIIDAELAISSIEYERSKCDLEVIICGGRWIPVEDALPPSEEVEGNLMDLSPYVLVRVAEEKEDIYAVARYDHRFKQWWSNDGCVIDKASHWQYIRKVND